MKVEVVALQLLVPLALIAALALVRWRSRTTWALAAVAVGSYILALALAGLWLLLPWYLPPACTSWRFGGPTGVATQAVRPDSHDESLPRCRSPCSRSPPWDSPPGRSRAAWRPSGRWTSRSPCRAAPTW